MQKKQSPVKPKVDYFNEFLLTFSNKRSLLSSKKIERFIVFNVFLAITIYYIFRNISVITPLEFVQVIGIWLVYGGYNSIMNYRDKKMDSLSATGGNLGEIDEVDDGRATPSGTQNVDNPD